MLRIAAEFKNVPLRETQMLQQHPGSVGKLSGLYAPQSNRQALYDVVEFRVSAPTGEQL
jgi:hypothetical protein